MCSSDLPPRDRSGVMKLLTLLTTAVLLTSGSYSNAVEEPFWKYNGRKTPIRGIVETEPIIAADGTHRYGMFDHTTGLIHVSPRLTPWFRQCVVNHEKRHSEGYWHYDTPNRFLDCGDGTAEWFPAWELRYQTQPFSAY